MTALMQARDVRVYYAVGGGLFGRKGTVKAVDGVSFTLREAETLAVVGESGCGKSTLARIATLMEPPTSGELLIDGNPTADPRSWRALRLMSQMVFQNPFGSLNPRKTVGKILEEPLAINNRGNKDAREAAARAMMTKVGLRQDQYGRYPHMFSGGQRQRIAIARALVLRPKILVLDEPVSALDVSIRAQVLNLLAELQEEFTLAYVFVSHDLSVVHHIADEVMVVYLGHAVELGGREAVFSAPQHPYTRALLSATPVADPTAKRERVLLKGEPPSPIAPPPGCPFNPRCPLAFDRCRKEKPPLEVKQGRAVACWAATP
jgi:dipeptide transport system ATP-binding protein